MPLASFLRSLGAFLAGLVLAIAVISILGALMRWVFPGPSGSSALSVDELRALSPRLAPGLLLANLLSWGVGVAAGAFVAHVLARNPWPGRLVAFVVLASVLWVMALLPHPLWATLAAPILLVAAGYGAERLAHERGAA